MMAALGPMARRLRNASLLAAAAGIVLLVVVGRQSGEAWLPSYLFVWLFVLALSLGSLAWVAVHNLTGGTGARPRGRSRRQRCACFPSTCCSACRCYLRPHNCCRG